MRIALRTSGGRGEYEFAGSHDNVHVHDVIGCSIYIELIPNHPIYSSNSIQSAQGKPRIRLNKESTRIIKPRHTYLILADALLLPKPKRELFQTRAGKLQLVDNGYSIISIQFGIVQKTDKSLIIRPDYLILSNASQTTSSIDVIKRLRLIFRAYELAEKSADPVLQKLLKYHKEALYLGDDDKIGTSAKEIRKYIKGPDHDPLNWILLFLNCNDSDAYGVGLNENAEIYMIDDNDSTSRLESARNRLKQWRLLSIRDAYAQRFSDDVKKAYKYVCLFSGNYLPKIPSTNSPGVDSAHILPWAIHGINDIRNGICLDKLCHWAFDAGVLRLDFRKETDEYVLTIPEIVLQESEKGQIDLTPFIRLRGTIPASRLPAERALWPDPNYLTEYNSAMYVK
ncbi:MAG: HNH endonuclease [Holophagales bacterium]|jgi:hypothetical protein|nr:HNH endonuclease [Holophagales bacterium]